MSVEKLKSIINTLQNTFYDEKSIRTALECAYSDDKRAGNILFTIIDSGIIDNALLRKSIDKTWYKRYVDAIYDDYGVEKKLAKKYIGYWFEALYILYDDFEMESNEVPQMDKKSKNTNEYNALIDNISKTFDTLTESEKEAAVFLLQDLNDSNEGLIVASKVADRCKISKSLIVNAIKKLGIAGFLESKSRGVKGTYIKVKNKALFDVMDNYKKNMSFINSWRGR